MKILFYEYESKGHLGEYVCYLIRFLSRFSSEDDFYFVLPPDFNNKFPEESNLANISSNIFLKIITDDEHDYINKAPNRLIYFFRILKLLNFYSNNLNVDHSFVFNLNILQLPLIFFRTKYKISGIVLGLFIDPNVKSSLHEKIKYFRKKIQFRFLFFNKKITKVYLNDRKSCLVMNQFLSVDNFRYLPEPFLLGGPEVNFDIRKEFEIEPQRRILLHFGVLRFSKGTLEILDSIKYLPAEVLEKCCFLFSGVASEDEDFDLRLMEKIKGVKASLPKVKIIFINKFISDNAIKKGYFNQCDLVLMPYKNNEWSSAVMSHAIASKKPFIAVNKGIIGKITSGGNFGYLIDDCAPQLIASAIVDFFNNPWLSNEEKFNQFILSSSPENFASIIIKDFYK